MKPAAPALARAVPLVLALAVALASCAREPSHAPIAPAAAAPRDPLLPIAIVPRPLAIRRTPGAFVWPRAVRVAVTAGAGNSAGAVREELARLGAVARIVPLDARARDAEVRVEVTSRGRLRGEAYALDVSPRAVIVRAGSPAGVFYALQTLDQMTTRIGGRPVTATASIDDRPAYAWRGLHVDVARHFFTVAALERLIDAASHVKLNVLHLHLTDDAAWRVSSARYPALAADRHYAAADVRALVAYASRHAMTIVPELDMPAHADAALRAYPGLACGPVLCTTGAGFAFARTVLDEAASTFASPYVHAGVDEVPQASAADATAFASALAAHVARHGRRLVVWDDTVAKRPPRGAVVTVWTSRGRAAALAARGVDVVVASAPLYFDAAQGDPAQEPPATRYMSTLHEVYDGGVLPPSRSGAESGHVLGVEGCLWTEHIASDQRLFEMAFPRALALAEIAWTPRRARNWDDFLARLPAQLDWLASRGDPFHIPHVIFAFAGGDARFDAVPHHVQSVVVRTAARALSVTLTVPLHGAVIRYTTDASAPTAASRRYAAPFIVRSGARPVVLRAAAWYPGRFSTITEATVVRVPRDAMRAGSPSWAALVSP
ncbi:MAG TPA: family 20 glycosylhydrolase [Candidatus Elarobacter sp.]|nr:family 20 glycosylhydrolase [Candidatus Elarobacter sp.]